MSRATFGQKLISTALFWPYRRSLANSTLQLLNMAKIAWAFDLSPGPGAVDTDIETAYSDGFLIAPKIFPIVFKPRSAKHEEIIIKEYESIKPFFVKYED